LISLQKGGVYLKTSIGKMEWWPTARRDKLNIGDKKRSAAGGLISDLPILSKKDLILLNPLFQHSSIPSFHGVCLRHSQFTLTWPRGPGFLNLNNMGHGINKPLRNPKVIYSAGCR
jgi:hypothetical protein